MESLSIQIDDLREHRQAWREYAEWWRDEEQYRKDEWIDYRPWSGPRGVIETEISD